MNFDKSPAIVNPKEIQLIKHILGEFNEIEAGERAILSGDKIEIIAGALAGTKGKMIKYQGKNKIIIELDSIQQSIIINIPESFIRPVMQDYN